MEIHCPHKSYWHVPSGVDIRTQLFNFSAVVPYAAFISFAWAPHSLHPPACVFPSVAHSQLLGCQRHSLSEPAGRACIRQHESSRSSPTRLPADVPCSGTAGYCPRPAEGRTVPSRADGRMPRRRADAAGSQAGHVMVQVTRVCIYRFVPPRLLEQRIADVWC